MRCVMRNLVSFVKRSPGFGAVGLALAVALGCPASPAPSPGVIPAEDVLRNTVSGTGGKLINEGGPVFLLPGALKAPRFFTGELSGLMVRAERLDGGAFVRVSPVPVAADGNFTLRGPITSELFFATAEFTANDATHRMRALARAQSGEPIILDPASTLVAAKIALAAQARRLDDLSYVDTSEVTSQVRSVLSTALEDVPLDQTNEQLAQHLTDAAAKNEALAASLRKWEAALRPSSTPIATAKPSPSPSASLSPEPAESHEPVK